MQSLARLLLPSGGQLHARRNAWAAMSEDASRARARREAEVEVRRAAERSAAAQQPPGSLAR